MKIENYKNVAKGILDMTNYVLDNGQDQNEVKKLKNAMRASVMLLVTTVTGAICGVGFLKYLCITILVVQVIYMLVFGYLAGYKEYGKILIKSIF